MWHLGIVFYYNQLPHCFPRGKKKRRQTSRSSRLWAGIWDWAVGILPLPLVLICKYTICFVLLITWVINCHFVSQDTGCFTISMSRIGQTDLTSYFMWVDQMMCHRPPKIFRAVEIGWDRNTSLYEECDTERSKIATPNLPMWPSGTGVKVNLKVCWKFELSYAMKGEVHKILISDVSRSAFNIMFKVSICANNLKWEYLRSLNKSSLRRNHTDL
jgi:hypothetical protein